MNTSLLGVPWHRVSVKALQWKTCVRCNSVKDLCQKEGVNFAAFQPRSSKLPHHHQSNHLSAFDSSRNVEKCKIHQDQYCQYLVGRRVFQNVVKCRKHLSALSVRPVDSSWWRHQWWWWRATKQYKCDTIQQIPCNAMIQYNVIPSNAIPCNRNRIHFDTMQCHVIQWSAIKNT